MDIKRTLARASSRALFLQLLPAACTVCLLIMLPDVPARAQDQNDLSNKSLEELMNVKVVSASKKEEKLFKTAAAVYVITQEDIRRSGMTRIPDLLRMVPGLDVARIDGVAWAVSVRGFNRRFTDKLLVLIDGRSVYSHDTSGVYWEALDMPLDLIERIEVIRGPGGTLWGANAVNGVINIITKRASETQGGRLAVVGGSEDRGTTVEYGGKAGDSAYYRAYGKYLNSSGLVDASGRNAGDTMNSAHGGGRLDWQISDRDSLTLLGEIYDTGAIEKLTEITLLNPFGAPANSIDHYTGGNVLGLWDHSFSDTSQLSFQFYYDRSDLHIGGQGQTVNTIDFDLQHHFAWGDRQDIVWGLGYRLIEDRLEGGPLGPVEYIPPSRNGQIFSGFFQDDFTLIRDRLRLTVGSKLEDDEYAGWQVEPNVRLLWTPSETQTLWAAVSRAVRTPSQGEESIVEPFSAFPTASGLPAVATVFGNPHLQSEKLLAYEAGYRVEPTKRVQLDIATFYNMYHDLQTDDIGTPFFSALPVPRIVVPITFGNQMEGRTYGVEPSITWEATSFWKLTGSYSFLRMVLENNSGNLLGDNAGNSPAHEFQIRSYLNLPRNFQLDVAGYHVSSLPAQSVRSYTRLDARFGWRPSESLEFSFGGQNLLGPRHMESVADDALTIPTQVKRTIYAKMTWTF